MSPHEQFDELVKGRLSPLLKRHEYSRRRQTFHRRCGRNWAVINLQRSDKTTSEQVVFTINLGVASALLTGFAGGDPEKRPHVYDCQLEEGLGFLLPNPRDVWWVLDHETTRADHLATTLERHLAERALPWLDSLADDEALRDHWLETGRGDWRSISVLLAAYGPEGELERFLARERHRMKFNAGALEELTEHERRLAALRSAPSS